MSAVSFTVSRDESDLLTKITDRAAAFAASEGIVISRVSVEMDLTAAHANGCPLRLQALLDAPNADFVHDVFGISRHIDRQTGTLGGCFLPRCAQPEKKS